MKDERLQGLTGRGEARWDPEGLVGSGDTLHDTVVIGSCHCALPKSKQAPRANPKLNCRLWVTKLGQ